MPILEHKFIASFQPAPMRSEAEAGQNNFTSQDSRRGILHQSCSCKSFLTTSLVVSFQSQVNYHILIICQALQRKEKGPARAPLLALNQRVFTLIVLLKLGIRHDDTVSQVAAVVGSSIPEIQLLIFVEFRPVLVV